MNVHPLGFKLVEVEVEGNSQGFKTLFPSVPICDRMRQCLDLWNRITDNKLILSWIQFGVPYEFDACCPTPTRGLEYQLSEVMNVAREEELTRFSKIGIVKNLPLEDISTATFCGIFVVEQKDKLRPIIDQRHPNSFTTKIHFKMDSLRDVRDLIRQGEFMFKIDFKDAYLHIKFRRPHWKYSAFWWKGIAKCFIALMFGHVHGPRWWTKLMKPIVGYLRSLGIRCVIYLDDLLVFCGNNFSVACEISKFICSFLLALGITLNTKKSVLTPVRRLIYLGFVVDSESMTFSVDSDKLKGIQRICRRLISRKSASARDLAHILGKISSMSNALLPWRLRTRAMLISKNQVLRATKNWDFSFPIGDNVLAELEFWLTNIKFYNGSPILHEPPNWTITSDSSALGFGGHSQSSLVAHPWESEWQNRHSTILETLAASRVIQEIVLEEDLQNGILLHQTDNTTAVSYLNKQGGKIPEISEIAESTWDFCLERGIVLRAQYVPGVDLGSADFLSRIHQNPSESSLTRKDFDLITRTWGIPSIDLFATRFNRKVPRFVSLFPDPLAENTDAFTMAWNLESLAFAFPPFNQIGRILAKVRRDPCNLILVTPQWPGAIWSPDLHLLKKSTPLLLSKKILKPNHQESDLKWNLLAWRL